MSDDDRKTRSDKPSVEPISPERWLLSPSTTAFVLERADRLKTDPATVLEDLVLVERRRVEGSI